MDTVGNKDVDYSNVETTEQGTFLLKLPKSEVQVELRILTGQDEKEMLAQANQRTKHNLPEEPISGRYARMIKSINGTEDPVFIRSFISIMDSRLIRKTYLNLMPDVDFVYKFNCKECEHPNEGGVPFTGDFFWPDE